MAKGAGDHSRGGTGMSRLPLRHITQKPCSKKMHISTRLLKWSVSGRLSFQVGKNDTEDSCVACANKRRPLAAKSELQHYATYIFSCNKRMGFVEFDRRAVCLSDLGPNHDVRGFLGSRITHTLRTVHFNCVVERLEPNHGPE